MKAPVDVQYEGLCWPLEHQQELLRALYLPDEDALQAFEAWRDALDLDTLDGGSLALMPLLHRRLRSLGIQEDPLARRIAGSYRYHFCKNQIRQRANLRLLDTVVPLTKKACLLKGMAVLPFYRDVALRPMNDVDLLISHEDARRVLSSLTGRGFRLVGRLEEALLREHGIGLENEALEIDVHWRSLLEDLSPSADDALWAGAREVEMGASRVLVPSDEDLLFHICIHGVRFSRMLSVIWACDAMEIIRSRPSLDWQQLVREAQRRFLQVPLREALRFLREELKAAVPAEVISELAPPEPTWVFWMEHHAFCAEPRASGSVHRVAVRLGKQVRQLGKLPPALTNPPASLSERPAPMADRSSSPTRSFSM